MPVAEDSAAWVEYVTNNTKFRHDRRVLRPAIESQLPVELSWNEFDTSPGAWRRNSAGG